jgi:hypothetical protein
VVDPQGGDGASNDQASHTDTQQEGNGRWPKVEIDPIRFAHDGLSTGQVLSR